jgi:hypothetical protein
MNTKFTKSVEQGLPNGRKDGKKRDQTVNPVLYSTQNASTSSSSMIELIDPVPPEQLRLELQPEMQSSSFRGLEVYQFSAKEAPVVMQEVGRIREEEFRRTGAGRNVSSDVDSYDTEEPCYQQMIAFDRERGEIAAAIRWIACATVFPHGTSSSLRTRSMFHYSPRFESDYLPHAVELGRSVVNKSAAKASMGLFSLWAGLSAMISRDKNLRYLFGVVSHYASYPVETREAILAFLMLHHGCQEGLVTALPDLRHEPDLSYQKRFTGTDYEKDFSILRQIHAGHGVGILPILLSYLGTTRSKPRATPHRR